MKSIFDQGYDKGFAEGADIAKLSDSYWLRVFSGQAMQGMFSDNTAYSRDVTAGVKQCVVIATAILAELKKTEVQDE
jgi:hypothetical protein